MEQLYRKTRKRGSWSTMASSWDSLSSMFAAPVPLPERKPCRTSLNWMLARRQVLMMYSTTFHSVYRRSITWVYVLTLEIKTRMVHPNYHGISR